MEDKIVNIIIFFLGFIVIAGITVLFFYTAVMREAAKTSRCKRLQEKYQKNAVYSADSFSSDGTKLISVNYNLGTKKSGYECMCPKGDILNEFSFNLRDLRNNKDRQVTLKCSCDDIYEQSTWEGYPELADYMRDARNKRFFI